jgi:hypothetical protein
MQRFAPGLLLAYKQRLVAVQASLDVLIASCCCVESMRDLEPLRRVAASSRCWRSRPLRAPHATQNGVGALRLHHSTGQKAVYAPGATDERTGLGSLLFRVAAVCSIAAACILNARGLYGSLESHIRLLKGNEAMRCAALHRMRMCLDDSNVGNAIALGLPAILLRVAQQDDSAAVRLEAYRVMSSLASSQHGSDGLIAADAPSALSIRLLTEVPAPAHACEAVIQQLQRTRKSQDS